MATVARHEHTLQQRIEAASSSATMRSQPGAGGTRGSTPARCGAVVPYDWLLQTGMLRIYVTSHCRGYDTARQRAAHRQLLRPDVAVDVIDVEAPGAEVPAQVIGTPMYLWNGRVVFRGNPSMAELLGRVRSLQDRDEHTRTG